MGRFINEDNTNVLDVSPTSLMNKNLYAYCDDNPVTRLDITGTAWETIFDIASLVFSAVEVANNPTDLTAWAALVGDAVDLIPFVTGVGETIRTLRTADKIVEGTDTVIDTYSNLRRITRGSGQEVHHIVEKRFAQSLDIKNTNNMYSIALTSIEHRNYTNQWRKLLPYGKKYSSQTILKAAAQIYSDSPRLMGVVLVTMLNK